MTESSPDHDELVSAYLDDEATTEERARVQSDPALLARVEALRAVHDALASPAEGPTTAERDTTIRAALGAATVVPITAARGRRGLRIASIAAAVALVLGAAGFLVRAANDKSDTKFNAATASVASSPGSPTAERTNGAAAPSAATSTFSANGRAQLGSFADRSALANAAQTQVHSIPLDQAKQESSPTTTAAPSTNTANGDAAAPTCLVPLPADATFEAYAASAVLEGRAVQVDVFTIADGSLVLVVTDAATCTQVFSQPV
ncbi:MAG: hypothetical protein QOD72_1117 [Acidimicrobiaceae bacterium]|nr:hypothetical protein [Acidimicrobiaceae bacterium]